MSLRQVRWLSRSVPKCIVITVLGTARRMGSQALEMLGHKVIQISGLGHNCRDKLAMLGNILL